MRTSRARVIPATVLGRILCSSLGAAGGDRVLRLPLAFQEQAAFIPDDDRLTAEENALGSSAFWDEW